MSLKCLFFYEFFAFYEHLIDRLRDFAKKVSKSNLIRVKSALKIHRGLDNYDFWAVDILVESELVVSDAVQRKKFGGFLMNKASNLDWFNALFVQVITSV